MKYNTTFAFLLICVLSFAGCGKDDDGGNGSQPNITEADVISNYADLVLNDYQAALNDAIDLRTSINNFVADPTAMKFQLAKNAWLIARESYGPTEAFRFANGPIDVIGGEEGPEGLLNSWPLDESYIDYIDGSNTTGIINKVDSFPVINKALLEELNGKGGEANVATGYHAIEYLLWGQDLTDPSELQAGNRAFTDFVDGGTAANADRRRDYLAVCADLIVDHLNILIGQWRNGGSYRTTFLAEDTKTALSNIMTGIATLSKAELAGERVFVAYTNRDQEDEHSCFADNTHRDLRLNFDGIRDVYLGRYGARQGASIHDLIDAMDKGLAQEIMDQLDEAQSAVYGTAIPFDYAISDESTRPAVLQAVTALQLLGDKIVEGGSSIGVQVTAE